MDRSTVNLFSLFQKLDYRDKESSAKKKLIGIVTAYLFANTILSYNYFISFDEKSFIILSYTSNLFLLALMVLSDFDNLFLASRSIDVLKTLPVKSSSVFTAKFLSAVLYLLIFILTPAVPQVIFFYQMNHDISRVIGFIVSDISFCYFSVGVLILIYMFALKYLKQKATLVVNFLQILFFVFIFYSSTLSSKNASVPKELFVRENILKYGPVKFLPQTFFSNAVDSIYYLLICILMAVSVFMMLYIMISKDYYSLSERIRSYNSIRSKPKPGFSIMKIFDGNHVFSNHYEKASFLLVKDHLQNSKFLRIKYIPIIFMPLVFVAIGMLSDLPHLLFFNASGGNPFFKTAIPVISPSVTFTLIMCSRLLISNTKILDSNSLNTGWIYDSLPISDRIFVMRGAAKFIYFVFIFPILILITILLLFKADFSVVLYNILFISAGIYLISSVSLLFNKTYPFTLESTKFNSASKFIEIFFSILLGAILFLIQIFIFQNIIFVIISIPVFIIISVLLNRN